MSVYQYDNMVFGKPLKFILNTKSGGVISADFDGGNTLVLYTKGFEQPYVDDVQLDMVELRCLIGQLTSILNRWSK